MLTREAEVARPDFKVTPELEEKIKKETVLVTSTRYEKWYPGDETEGEEDQDRKVNKVRGDLALAMIREALDQGIRVVAIDSKASAPAFKQALGDLRRENLLTIDEEKESSRGGSRRQGYKVASALAGKGIVYVDAEKLPFVRDCFVLGIEPFILQDADIGVIGRDAKEMDTIPPAQKTWEIRGSTFWNRLHKRGGLIPNVAPYMDIYFGVRYFKNTPDIVDLFCREYKFNRSASQDDNARRVSRLHASDPDDWVAHFLPITEALHEGYSVKYTTVPYRHPPSQTQSEVDNKAIDEKRQRQFNNVMMATMHLIASYGNNPGSRISRKGA